jgi:uncharacterized membrane protein YfcA
MFLLLAVMCMVMRSRRGVAWRATLPDLPPAGLVGGAAAASLSLQADMHASTIHVGTLAVLFALRVALMWKHDQSMHPSFLSDP